MDVTVCVGTFGDMRWWDLARQRAIPSARGQAQIVHVHGNTLHEARNTALARVNTKWVIFLDADDALSPDYAKQMATGAADVRAPAVSYVRPNGNPRLPYVPRVAGHKHDCDAACIASGAGNWIVIGACVRTELVRQVGGFESWAIYEDFALWLRCVLAGATVEAIPSAVYIAHVRQDSRNRAPSMDIKNRVHHDIVTAILGDKAAT